MDENSESAIDANINCPLNCCKSGKFNKVWKSARPINIMVFMFFFGFSVSIHIRYRDNLVYRQLCRDQFHDDYMFCYEVPGHHNVTEKDLQLLDVLKNSNSHVFAMIGLKIIFECVSSCLLCSWSDRCGRKFPLLIALLGENFDISSFFFSDAPFVYFIWALYVFTALSGLFGGYICIFTMSYCYVTDCYSVKDRTLAFTMIDFTFMIGIVGGVVTFKKCMRGDAILISFLSIFTVRCVLIIWMLLTFSEKHFDFNNEKFSKKIIMLFSTIHVKKIYEVMTSWRRNCENEQLVLIIFSAIPVMIFYSLIEGVILASSIHARLFETFRDYEEISLYFAIYTCFAEPIAMVIYGCIAKFKDSTIGIIGFWNIYLGSFVAAFATDYLTFLVGLGLSPLKGFAAVGLRSAYSKIAEEQERGKLFFLYTFGEVFATFIGYFLYYRLRLQLTQTEDILPHMIMATLLIVSLCTFTFQVMSINTSHLFEKCYRNIPIQSLQNLTLSSERR